MAAWAGSGDGRRGSCRGQSGGPLVDQGHSWFEPRPSSSAFPSLQASLSAALLSKPYLLPPGPGRGAHQLVL